MVLGDRELTITLARVWHSLGFWEKIKLTSTLLWTGIRCGQRLLDRQLGAHVHAAKGSQLARQDMLPLRLMCILRRHAGCQADAEGSRSSGVSWQSTFGLVAHL